MIEVFFYLIAAIVIIGALGVVLVPNIVYAALFLIMSLLGVAAVYIMLSVEFLALVQVLIYGGAVMVLILFALMLSRAREIGGNLDGDQKPLAAVATLALVGVFFAMLSQTTWPRDNNTLTTIPFNDIGSALFNRWAVPFEIASAVLLVALIGAVVISMEEEPPAAAGAVVAPEEAEAS